MDAQIAYGFHHLRNEKPYLARGPITNKVCKWSLHNINFFFVGQNNWQTCDCCHQMQGSYPTQFYNFSLQIVP
jgi:hypothetical protein